MNISSFFITRPIFAAVLSLMLFIAGLVSLPNLPISEYPEVVPPTVTVNAQFPGATPETIIKTVATPLEEQINGVENMLYLSSQATTDGALVITVTFKLGTNPDQAQQLVQNRVAQAESRLPDITRQIGVTTLKSSPDLTLVVNMVSPNGQYDSNYLRNYAVLNISDQLARLPGIGQVSVFGGGDYAMRLWLDPNKLSERNLTAGDVVAAVQAQNVQVAAGTVGAQPTNNPLAFQLQVNATGRLSTPEEFGQIILKTSSGGGVVYLKDVARIELGAGTYSLKALLNNKQAAAIGIFQAPGSNALALSSAIRAKMAELKKNFPAGVDYAIDYDPTQFVRASIEAVIHTLVEAVLLVVLVVIVFLQTWRASLIPLIAVPISVIGTFAIFYLFGFSINNLTLFGLVLAIGIVVDDAIVVVENVERNIENGLSPREATFQAMREVSGPIIAIALTLCAVFVPIAFVSGLSGLFYRQFALTIAISTVISAFNSLTLSPALAALLLRPHGAEKDFIQRGIDKVFGGFFARFNRVFIRGSEKYEGGVRKAFMRRRLSLLVYVALIACAGLLFIRVPTGYIPTQDKQYLVAFAQLPPGSSLDRTEKVIRTMADLALKQPGVANAIEFPGLSIAGFSNSSNAGIVFITLKPFEERTSGDLYGPAMAGKFMGLFNGAIKDAFVGVFPPPAVNGLGTIGGFKLEIEDRQDQGSAALYKALQAVQGRSYQTPQLAGVFSSYEINVPQLFADLNRDRARQLGVNIPDVFTALQVYLGSLYINDFNKFGRTYQVIAQADAPYRASAQDLLNLKVRNVSGTMIPLSSMLTVSDTFGPDRATHYNLYNSAELNAGPAPGVSSGQAQKLMENILATTLPPGFSYEWTELTYQQILAGNTAVYIFPLCVLLVFMVLAAQYESLILPLCVILIVPVVVACGMAGVWITGGDNNIFTQIGLVVLVGLACKNAILIVEFARELELQGETIVQAALTSCRLRLRPILMTSFAFIMGVTPLVFSHGAGAEMRHAIGVVVFAGMLGVTIFGLFLTPVFYVLLRTLSGGKPLQHAGAHVAPVSSTTKPAKGAKTEH